jgi:predicted amidohydrolase
MRTLRLGIFQFSPRLGEPDANAERIAGCAADVDVLLTPELSLTGYDLGDIATDHAIRVAVGEAFEGPHAIAVSMSTVIVGVAESCADTVTRNALVAVREGVVVHKHRKIHLPTYGMFDEARFWGRGDRLDPWPMDPWRIGFLVCEDFWHPGLVWALAARGVNLLCVAAAAPGRSVREPSDGRGMFGSWDSWERMARMTSEVYGMYVAVANRIGVEGGVTFAGGSLLTGPDGAVLARSGSDETLLECVLSFDEVARARRPWSHSRDDDRRIVMRAIEDASVE